MIKKAGCSSYCCCKSHFHLCLCVCVSLYIVSSGWTQAGLQNSTASKWVIKSLQPMGWASVTSPTAMRSRSWRATRTSCWPSGWETILADKRKVGVFVLKVSDDCHSTRAHFRNSVFAAVSTWMCKRAMLCQTANLKIPCQCLEFAPLKWGWSLTSESSLFVVECW